MNFPFSHMSVDLQGMILKSFKNTELAKATSGKDKLVHPVSGVNGQTCPAVNQLMRRIIMLVIIAFYHN